MIVLEEACSHRLRFMVFTGGREFDVQLDRKATYVLDGGGRNGNDRDRIEVGLGPLTLCPSVKVAA